MLRKIIYIVLLTLLCVLIIAGAVVYWHVSDASWLAMQVQKMTQQHAGIDVDIKDGVKLEFSPEPTLVLGNVHVHRLDGGLSAFIEKIEVVPVFNSILDGELNIQHVKILHPVLEIDTSTWEKNEDGIEVVKDDTNLEEGFEHVRLVSTLKNAIEYIFVDKLSSISLIDADIHITTPDTTYITVQNVHLDVNINNKDVDLILKINKSTVENGRFGSLNIEKLALEIPHIELRQDKALLTNSTLNYSESVDGDIIFNLGLLELYGIAADSNIADILTKDIQFAIKNTSLTDEELTGLLNWKATFVRNTVEENVNDALLVIFKELGMGHVVLPKMALANTLDASFTYDFKQNSVIVENGVLGLEGNVDIQEYSRAIEINLPFTWDEKESLSLVDAKIGLDDNVFGISAVCDGIVEGDPVVTGHVDMHYLSLTQLFGFARRLPNGLQNALNDIKGQFDFELDTEKVLVTKLDAVICGLDLSGTAYINDLSYPDLVLDISGPYLDANRVLPEINNQRPDAPVFAMKPIIAAPDELESAENGDDHFGFDIRVHAKDVDVYVLALHNLDFRCIPSERGTLLTFDSPNMYGGLVDLHLDITDGYELEGSIKHISLAEPLTQLAGWPAVSGVAELGFDIKAPFQRTLKTVLDGLTGTLDVKAEQGVILVDKSPETEPFLYQEASLLAHIEKEGVKPKDAPENWLSYDGTWQGHWLFPNGESGRYDLDGVVHFDFDTILPVACTDVPAHIHAFFPEAEVNIPKGVSTDFDALLTAQLDARWVTFKRMRGESRGISYKGRAKLEGVGTTMRWSGSFNAEHPSMRDLLKTVDFVVWPTQDPQAFGPMQLTSHFSYAGGVLSLHQAQFLMDGSRYGGNVRILDTRGSNTRPLLYFDVTVDSFNANAYFPADLFEEGSNIESSQKAWDLSRWHSCDMEGSFSFGELMLSKQVFTHVFAPISLDDGLFTMNELDASLHGGKVTLASRVDVGRQNVSGSKKVNKKEKNNDFNGLHAELVVNSRSIDVKSLATTVTSEDYLAGVLDGALSLYGDFACDADLTRALNGEWFLAIKNGYLSQSGQGELRDKRIAFSSATASGLVDNGRIENNNLTMESLLIDMDGYGWIDLPTKTVDYSVDVAFAHVPNIPINITGTWDKPNLSVNGVGIVTGTLVNIGSSVFNILGSVLMAPFDFLSFLGLGPQKDDVDAYDNGSIGPQGDGIQGRTAFVPILTLPPRKQ